MAMTRLSRLVVFSVGQIRLALPVEAVRRVVRAAEVTVIPNAPRVLLGLLDLQGEVIPVINMRSRLGLPERAIGLADQFLIAQTSSRTLALVIDQAQGLVESSTAGVPARVAQRWSDQVQGVAQLEDGLVLIQDLDKFLSDDEAQFLDSALEEAR